ncbi:MAG: ABC transporter substrate-binding protein [Pseudomonadales bacterium]|nr:ABC transporter substrate-binding protein [Pseudomonadales bacterium]MCP5343754.1 ABC transporter substrate-binding protein [Pseudomonadales bacterium]
MTLTLGLVACGGDSGAPSVEETGRDITVEAQAFYAANPEKYAFKTPADIPAGLVWEHGEGLSDIGSSEAKKGGTQYEYMPDFPATLRVDGPDSNGEFRRWLLDYTSLTLAHRHPNEFDFYPAIATEWAVDLPNKTVYARINPNARFTDGEPITADDFLFTFFYYLSPYVNAPWYANWYGTQYTNITKYDDHTISLTMAEAKPDMDALALGFPPTAEHFYKDLGPDFTERYQWRFVPTAGAYEIKPENVRMGTNIVMTHVENWWAQDLKFFRNRYNMDRINFNVIRDTANQFEAFRRGDLDQFKIRTADYWYERLPNDDPDVQAGYIEKAQFYNDLPRAPWGLWINSARPHLDNVEVRLGIQYASNWDLVLERYFRGDFTRLNSAEQGYGEFTNPDVKAREFDIAKAREHFAKAGFDRSGPDGILMNAEGERLAFTLSTHYERYRDIFSILKEEAIKAGLELRLEMLDVAAGSRKVHEKQHDIYFIALNYGIEMYPRYWDTYHSDNAYDDAFLDDGSVNPARKIKVQTNNMEELADFRMDQKIDRYVAASDKEEMITLAHELTQMHHDYASFVPGFVEPFYWHASWRWVRWPDDFNVKYSSYAEDAFVHWIDEDMKAETLAARRSGQTFEPQINVYDQYKKQ